MQLSSDSALSPEGASAELNSAASSESVARAAVVPVLQWSPQRRFKYFVTGVLGPIGCFAMSWSGMNARVDPIWQSGKLDVYLTLMLEPKALLPFMPLLIFSLLSLAACCVRLEFGRHWVVRLGIFGGGLLSVQYLLFVVIATSFFTLIAAAIVGPALALVTYLGAKLMPQARRVTIWQIMLLTSVVAVIAAFVAANSSTLSEGGVGTLVQLLLNVLMTMLIATPMLNCVTYVRATFALLRSPALFPMAQRDVRSLLASAIGWLLGFGASWKFAVEAMLSEYSRLPTSPPNCYISTAAACGHRQFVGVERFARSQVMACDLQSPFPVNDQMCRLKFLEFALAATSPSVHRCVRRVYNAFGPHAASICRSNVWLADASYVAFKPLEWLAELIRVAARVPSHNVQALYSFTRSTVFLRNTSG